MRAGDPRIGPKTDVAPDAGHVPKRLFFLPFYEMLERHLEETDYEGGRVATFDRSYLFDKIVRWSHTVGFGGNWFRLQIGAQLRVKAGSQSTAAAMNMALGRK